MTRNDDCPPLGDLARFIEGRLEESERARVVAHLDTCATCYEVFAESVRTDDELEAEDAEGEEAPSAPRPLRGRPVRPRWLGPTVGLAAAAILTWAVVGGPLRGLVFGGGLAPTAEMLRVFDPEELSRAMSDPDWDLHGWPVTRGGAPSGVADDLAFRVGVRLVDFEAASLAGHETRAARDRLLLQLRSVELAEALVAAYEQLPDPAPAPDRAELEAATLAHLDTPYAELGRWVESVRLAALTGDATFSSRIGRAPTVVAPPTPVAQAYADLQTELAGDAPNAARVATLAAQLIATAGGA